MFDWTPYTPFVRNYVKLECSQVKMGFLFTARPSPDKLKEVIDAVLTCESESISGHLQVAKALIADAERFQTQFESLIHQNEVKAAENFRKSRSDSENGWIGLWKADDAERLHKAAGEMGMILLSLDETGVLEIDVLESPQQTLREYGIS
jgi:hypothetical protein